MCCGPEACSAARSSIWNGSRTRAVSGPGAATESNPRRPILLHRLPGLAAAELWTCRLDEAPRLVGTAEEAEAERLGLPVQEAYAQGGERVADPAPALDLAPQFEHAI